MARRRTSGIQPAVKKQRNHRAEPEKAQRSGSAIYNIIYVLVYILTMSQKYKDRQVTRPAGGGTQDLSKRNLLHSYKLCWFLTSPKEKL